jgi:hypothetical protein
MMQSKQCVPVVVFLLLFHFYGMSQHIPDLINYKVAEYKAHNQNWSVSQSADRWMYFGNTDGLLAFNGNQWSKNTLENNKIIRSVHCHQNRIYTGAYGEFGYWVRDECGSHVYTSLIHLVPKNAIEKEEIWHIISDGTNIYFQSFSLLMKYDGKRITKIDLPGSIMFLNIVNGRKLIQSLDYGIYEIKDDKYAKIEGSDFFANMTVTNISLLPNTEGDLLVSTSSHGIFVFNDGKVTIWSPIYQNYLVESQVNKCFLTKDNLVVIGTIRDGLLIFNMDGSIRYHIKSANGLQNNTVLSLAQDADGHLWVGLDKGISHIKMNENILYYRDQSGNLGTVYCMLKDNDYLYIGTNQGLYYFNENENKAKAELGEFRLVKGTQGQVWELKKVKDLILCGHNDGTFVIERSNATKISGVTGGWYIQHIDSRDDWLIQGTYTGLIMLKKAGNTWKFSHRLSGYNEPVKKIIQKSAYQFWVTGPNLGLSVLTMDTSLNKIIEFKKIGSSKGLIHNQNPDINIFDHKLVLFDGNKHFYYDDNSNQFALFHEFNEGNTDYLVRNVMQNCWAKVYKDSIVMFRNGQKMIFNISTNKDYHSLTQLDAETVGICLNEGYAVIDLAEKWSNTAFHQTIKLHTIELNQRKTCLPIPDNALEIDFKDNDFKIYFYDTEYLQEKKYWYRLLPYENEWKALNRTDYMSFSNLMPGSYTFELKSQHQVSKLDLNILPPWYKSKLAYFIYLLMGLLMLWYIQRYFEKQLQLQTQKLHAENERLLREQKIAMENDRLLQENLLKSKELANSTMHLIQKNELLQEIKEELIQIRKSGDQILTTKDFQIMMKQINDNLTVQEDKKLFNESFEDVHEAFFKQLKKDFPDISGDDLKLAAYLKMDLSSKEIAPLFNISMRGMENKRYRLRKKMGVGNEVNLTEYFKNYLR